MKRYRNSKVAALDGISFDVHPGEFFALLGPNGAGKTTAISILTTTLAKTSGKVTIAGFDLDRQAKEVRQNIGIVFQNPSLDANLTAEENIRLHVGLYGIYSYRPSFQLMPRSYREQVVELAKVLGIAQEIFKQVKTFSGGMKRKLEIVRSLMHNPKVLFLDEPTQGLDAVSRNALWDYLRSIHKSQKTTIFLTTHYLEEADGADRVCIVSHGKLLFMGTPNAIKDLMMDKYLVVDSEDRQSLYSSLAQYNPQINEDGSLSIPFSESTPQDIISSIKTKLSVMRVHVPSLEEAYIDMVSDQEEN